MVVLANLNGTAPDRLGAELMTLAQGREVVLRSERRAVALPPEALAAYEGVYEATPNFALTVSTAGGRLMIQATGQSALELHAEGDDAFFLREVEARISFARNAAGEVEALTLHQNGRDLPARKK